MMCSKPFNDTEIKQYRILSFVGGHDICVYSECKFDESIRKFRPGRLIGVIPYSGRMLNATILQSDEEPLCFEGMKLSIKSKPVYKDVDDIPGIEICDFCIVSNIYAAACKELGYDTSRLLTIGGSVVDENNNIIGVCFFNRN